MCSAPTQIILYKVTSTGTLLLQHRNNMHVGREIIITYTAYALPPTIPKLSACLLGKLERSSGNCKGFTGCLKRLSAIFATGLQMGVCCSGFRDRA